MNNYKNPNSKSIGIEGAMYNENMKTEKDVVFNHYGIFSNDNTYAVTFNHKINLPPTKYFENKPVKQPPSNQHITKPLHEPPVCITDGGYFIRKDKASKPPELPPYLKKPEKLGEIQGKANEKNKGRIYYYKPQKLNLKNIHY